MQTCSGLFAEGRPLRLAREVKPPKMSIRCQLALNLRAVRMKIEFLARMMPRLLTTVMAKKPILALQKHSATERVLCFDEVNGNQLWNHHYAVDYPDWAFDPQHGGCPRATPIILKAGGKRQLIVWTEEAVTSLDPNRQ